MKKKLIIIFLIISGCQFNDKNDLLSQFNNTTKLTGTELQIKEGVLGNPMELISIDSLLFIIDFYDNTWLNIISANSYKQINKAIYNGKGPNEIQRPYQIIVTGSKTFDIYDIFPKKLISYHIDSIIGNKRGKPIKTEQFILNTARILNILQIGKDKYFSVGILPEGKYCIIDKKSGNNKYFGKYPDDPKHKNAKNNILGSAYQGKLGFNTDKNKIVWANFKSPILEILTISDKTINVKTTINYGLPIYDEETDNMGGFSTPICGDNKFGFRDLNTTNEYIYTLYSGRSYDDYGDDALKGEYILIFNWDGKPIKKIKLDRDIFHFTITKDNKYLYAIAQTPFPKIVKYSL